MLGWRVVEVIPATYPDWHCSSGCVRTPFSGNGPVFRRCFMRKPTALATALLCLVPATPALARSHTRHRARVLPLAVSAPDNRGSANAAADATTGCTSPAPVRVTAYIHCYAPADIAAHYGVDSLQAAGWRGDGQTIVLVDSYGSPTAATDLKFFHDTFFS